MSTSVTTKPTLVDHCFLFIQNINFRTHLIISIVLRLILILYSEIHDAHSEVPYTDIDYRVVVDGARQVLEGQSPFQRHTYRYSPVFAYLQLPSVLLHPLVGKFIYCCFDIFVALLIFALVRLELQSQCNKAVKSLLNKLGKLKPSQNYNKADERMRPEKIARASACFWLYNPLTAVISTRGNGDSFSSFFVILTIYWLAKSEDVESSKSKMLIFLAGISHGFAMHLRLYPLLFSLAYFLCLSERLTSKFSDFFYQLLCPSCKQLILIFGTIVSFGFITGLFYHFYGWQYIYEAYLYHFIRTDSRHNFSFYFLMQYLGSNSAQATLLEKILIIAPQLYLLINISFSFGQFRQTLPFCIFSLTFVMVTYNSVVTSQYFVWYLALLPICLNNLQSFKIHKAIILLLLWLLAQGLWLLPAYLLEFKTWNTFYLIGANGALFFLVNNFLLVQFIKHYSFSSFKVNFKKLL